jgi:tRNA-dihydrouridine synthase 4
MCRKTVELCQRAEKCGATWVSVHGRTKDQRCEPVNYQAIRTIKDSMQIPVVANGDIKSLADVTTVSELTGVDGEIFFVKVQICFVGFFLQQ